MLFEWRDTDSQLLIRHGSETGTISGLGTNTEDRVMGTIRTKDDTYRQHMT